jgi:hypothetical protein
MGGASEEPIAAWVPRKASELVRNFVSDVRSQPGGDSLELDIDALVLMLDAVFARRESARLKAAQGRHRRRLEDFRRQTQHAKRCSEAVHEQKLKWLQDAAQRWGKGGCGRVLAKSIGKAHSLSRCCPALQYMAVKEVL